VKRLTVENESLFEANETIRRLNEDLTASESKCSEYEAKVRD